MRLYRVFNNGKRMLPGRHAHASVDKSMKRTTDLFAGREGEARATAVPVIVEQSLYGLTDYPSFERSWPLMTRRFLNALIEHESFSHTWLPAKLFLRSGVEVDKEKFGFI
ncbi:MAG: hypothetical protein AB8B55_06430 [Mariniblastus sp.]